MRKFLQGFTFHMPGERDESFVNLLGPSLTDNPAERAEYVIEFEVWNDGETTSFELPVDELAALCAEVARLQRTSEASS